MNSHSESSIEKDLQLSELFEKLRRGSISPSSEATKYDPMKREKEQIRKRIWSKMEEANVARFPRPVFGRIPNFVGADVAARRLDALAAFRKANTVFSCPDSPQRSVRLAILQQGKILIMATPRLRRGFILLRPDRISSRHYADASSITGAFKYGELVEPSDLRIDLKVTGSVAVTSDGGRVGKGGGYSDLEYAILKEYNCITDRTPVATTLHDVQVVESVPMDPSHDMPVDFITTPTRLIETKTRIPRPRGIAWNILSEKQIQEIPLLRTLRESQH